MRIFYGPGYRIFYRRCGDVLYGGDKDSQARDIARAQELADELED